MWEFGSVVNVEVELGNDLLSHSIITFPTLPHYHIKQIA
jgi:hypothetical protein